MVAITSGTGGRLGDVRSIVIDVAAWTGPAVLVAWYALLAHD